MTPELSLPERSSDFCTKETNEVNADSLPNFLIGIEEYFPYKSWSFAHELDLSNYAPLFKRLYDSKTKVYKHPEHVRKFYDEVGKHFYKDTDELWWEEQDEAERSMTQYYDLNTRDYYHSQIHQGDYSQVKISSWSDLSENIVPLIEMHTHPDDSLPSPVDYFRMISKGYQSGRSVTRGIVVLAPSQQILALPSNNTPIFDQDDAYELVERAHNKLKSTLTPMEINRLRRIEKIRGAIIDRIDKIYDRKEDIIREVIEVREQDGAITYSQGKELRDEVNEDFEESKNMYQNYHLYLGLITNEKYKNKFNLAYNTLLLEFARSIDVQLYQSTDMKKFKKWTA